MTLRLGQASHRCQLDIAHSTISAYCNTYYLEVLVTVRDMQRRLATLGISASALDQVTRKLREDGRIPNAGRGANAPDIGSHEAALILLAVAGSEAASRPRLALARLALQEIEDDTQPRFSRNFVRSIEALLSSGDAAGSVSEVRVAQGNGRSSIVYDDGHIEHFVAVDRPGIPALTTQGIIWGGLLGELENELSGERFGKSGTPSEMTEINHG